MQDLNLYLNLDYWLRILAYFLILNLLKKDFIYLFLDKGEGKEKERERNINVWLPLMSLTLGDLARNPGMCPRLGIEPATLWFAGPRSIPWATPARVDFES